MPKLIRIRNISLLFGIFLLMPTFVVATGGACSWHDGVDCGRGWQQDGRVYCNDGWTESMTYYEFTQKCVDTPQQMPSIIDKYIIEKRTIVGYYNNYDEEYKKCLSLPSNERFIDKLNSCTSYARAWSSVYYCPLNSKKIINEQMKEWCVCNEGYYNPNGDMCAVGEYKNPQESLQKWWQEINTIINSEPISLPQEIIQPTPQPTPKKEAHIQPQEDKPVIKNATTSEQQKTNSTQMENLQNFDAELATLQPDGEDVSTATNQTENLNRENGDKLVNVIKSIEPEKQSRIEVFVEKVGRAIKNIFRKLFKH